MSNRRFALLVTAAAFALCGSAAAAPPSDEELFAGAEARIEKHRKADAAIRVVDAAGKPLAGAKVEVRQTRHAFLFGSNIFRWGRLGDERLESEYRERFGKLLNFATLPFYWPMYEPKAGQPMHDYAERVARWCGEHDIKTKGHPLAWNFRDPVWLPDDNAEIFRLQLARIDDCVTRMQGLIDTWDVVNEATYYIRPNFSSPKITAAWKAQGQIEFTRACFERARKANPAATLLINDYANDAKYVQVIEKLVDAEGKRLYDTIGLQSHMHRKVLSNRQLWEVCERFSRFHVPLHFTEMTVLSGEEVWEKSKGEPWPTTPEGEARQAREVARIYTMLYSHPAVEAITWWDFSDNGAWKQAPAGLLRKDMSPKPAYDELMKLIKGHWWTSVDLRAGDGGEATFRGMLGDYKVRVIVPGKEAVEKAMSVKKDGENRVMVTVPQATRS